MDTRDADKAMSRCIIQYKGKYVSSDSSLINDPSKARIYRDGSDARIAIVLLHAKGVLDTDYTEIVYCFNLPRVFLIKNHNDNDSN